MYPAGYTAPLLANSELPFADPYDLARRLRHIPEPLLRPTPGAPIAYRLGDKASFWVLDLDLLQSFQISATLRHISPHLYMWVQDGVSVSLPALQKSAETFEQLVYPTAQRYFGREWSPGIDNDVRLTVLNARIRGAAGYFLSSDEYPRTIVPTSNEREMFYINVDQEEPGSASYDATLAHELQHMVHWFADPNEDSWVSEGLSELAEHLCGYSKHERVRVFARNPDLQLTDWPAEPGFVTAHYGAAFTFMAYFAERFGPDMTRALVAEARNGAVGLEAVLQAHGQNLSFEDVFGDWVIANYLDGRGQAVDGKYEYRGLDIQVGVDSPVSGYPFRREGTVKQYGADYVELPLGNQDLRIEFIGDETTRMVPNSAHGGRYQWSSMRGDNGDMTLTRLFDLRGLSTATLRCWLWYDIEPGWDYAYVEASTDGELWHLLPGKHTTKWNPVGQSYGTGYTGKSGQHVTGRAQWVEERIDLSPFVGQQVWIRFEYITDDSVSGPGLCLDDIAIPQLGYRHDVEQGDDGWVANGFVRTDNTLPQRYLLQVIRLAEGVSVERQFVDGRRTATLTVPGTHQGEGTAVLVISAITRFSYEAAAYRYEIRAVE